jgi:hypothetical protein
MAPRSFVPQDDTTIDCGSESRIGGLAVTDT